MKLYLVAALLLSMAACRTTDNGSQPLDQTDPGSSGNTANDNATQYTGALRHKGFEVRFTNPVCKDYHYSANQSVTSNSGQVLTQKPKNTFCSYTDTTVSASRPEAPQYKLIEWIKDPETKEIFFAYLSFSNRTVQEELCRAVTDRNVKITFVLDDTTDLTRANALLACAPANGDPAFKPQLLRRGHTTGIGYAHNKIFFINPNIGHMRIAVSSGNMSSGIVLHHENWLFIQPERDTYFAEAHRCLMEGQINHYQSKSKYENFIKQCRSQIQHREETDIKTYFVPGEGGEATKAIEAGVESAENIKLAAHRFSYNKLLASLKKELESNHPASLQMLLDDDIYWAGQGQQVGDNQRTEYTNAINLQRKGGKIKWMETNHGEHLLHHNKFIVFNQPQGATKKSGVFTGAGNFTGTAFNSNFENFYYIEMPEVVDAYNKQYDMMWNSLATETEMLPRQNILPPTQ